MEDNNNQMGEREAKANRFEMRSGIVLAIFTAILAISGLAGDSYGEAILVDTGEKANAYDWYSSKSIKQTLTGNEKNTLEALVQSDALAMDAKISIKKEIYALGQKIERYEKEKKEILVGSANIDESEWAQDIDGELGKVFGAQEWESDIELNEEAGGRMDLAGLFLEIALVVGAFSLVMQGLSHKRIFLTLSVIIGIVGAVYMILGLRILWPF